MSVRIPCYSMTLEDVQNSSEHCCCECPGGHFQKVGECVALCNVSRYVTKSRDMRECDLVREMFFRTVLLQPADML